jgi:single-strand DNA-binding protein
MARTTSTTTPEAPAAQATPQQRRSSGPALNRVELLGRIASDVELRYTSSGLPVCTLRVATNDRELAEFHDVVVWRQLAEFAGQYLAKGRLVYVQGRLHGRSWQAENGTTRRSVEVVAEDLQVLDRPPAKDGAADKQPDAS